jgi:hypothetical protein
MAPQIDNLTLDECLAVMSGVITAMQVCMKDGHTEGAKRGIVHMKRIIKRAEEITGKPKKHDRKTSWVR